MRTFSGKLYADIPLGTVLQYLDKLDGVQQGTNSNGNAIDIVPFKLEVVVWYGEDNATADKMTMSESLEIRASRNPTADLSHLSSEDREFLDMISSPVNMNHNWTINLASGFHDGKGLYALDFNASDDNNVPVIAPGLATIINPTRDHIIDGTAVLEFETASGQKFRMTLMHLDKMYQNQTGLSYVPMTEAMEQQNLFNVFADEIAAENEARRIANGGYSNDMSMAREFFDFFQGIPEAKVKLDPYLAQIDQVVAAIQTYVNNGNKLIGGSTFAEIGNEGYSSGSHLHIEITDLDNNAIHSYGWIDAYSPGIKFNGAEFNNGKILNGLTYSSELGVLVQTDLGIAMTRENVAGGGGNGYVALNRAYAIEDSLSMGELTEITWTTYASARLEDGTIVSDYKTWSMTDNEGNTWEWVDGRWQLIEIL